MHDIIPTAYFQLRPISSRQLLVFIVHRGYEVHHLSLERLKRASSLHLGWRRGCRLNNGMEWIMEWMKQVHLATCFTRGNKETWTSLQVLNAMLLACCSEDANPKDKSPQALEAIQSLLDAGAVPDTWAPNGNSVSYTNLKCPETFRAHPCTLKNLSETWPSPIALQASYLQSQSWLKDHAYAHDAHGSSWSGTTHQ